MGVAVRGVWRECARVVRGNGVDGEVDGVVARAGLDLPQPVPELGPADQRIAVLCDSVYFVVVVFYVVAVPETDLYKSLTADLTDDSRCREERDQRVPWCADLYRR